MSRCEHKAFVEVYEPMSLFPLFLKSRQRFQCELTYRTPAAAAEGEISVRLNRVEVGVFPASVKWASVKIADLDLVAGRNELAIIWPPLKDVGLAHLRQSEQEIRRNTPPNPLADFGDVHRLRLTIVSGDHPTKQKTADTLPAT